MGDTIHMLFAISACIMIGKGEHLNSGAEIGNISNTDKDMYVIHATVYEVGIVTNRTENSTKNLNNTGQQESVTFYHTDGNTDLGNIPRPLLTNITAHSAVGISPVTKDIADQVGDNLSRLESIRHPTNVVTSESAYPLTEQATKYKRGLDDFITHLFKRSTNDSVTAKVTKGTAIIPSEVGVQSIALPPLLSFNNNLSGIPVPIPNTSVVKYAKVNTLVKPSENVMAKEQRDE